MNQQNSNAQPTCQFCLAQTAMARAEYMEQRKWSAELCEQLRREKACQVMVSASPPRNSTEQGTQQNNASRREQ